MLYYSNCLFAKESIFTHRHIFLHEWLQGRGRENERYRKGEIKRGRVREKREREREIDR